MEPYEANKQFCKMQGEIADRLGLKTICSCGDTMEMVGEIPDEVIAEMWSLIADGYLFRYVREIFTKERPKGRRLNLEELYHPELFRRALILIAKDCEMLHYDDIELLCTEVLEGKTEQLELYESEMKERRNKG